jgi:ribosomal protein L31E
VAPTPAGAMKRPLKTSTSITTTPPPSPMKSNDYIVLIDYRQVKKKVPLKGIKTLEEFTNQLLTHFKLSPTSLDTLEYWDPDFNDWVLLDSLQNVPNKVKVRVTAKDLNSSTTTMTESNENTSQSSTTVARPDTNDNSSHK